MPQHESVIPVARRRKCPLSTSLVVEQRGQVVEETGVAGGVGEQPQIVSDIP